MSKKTVVATYSKKCTYGPEAKPEDIIVLIFSNGSVRPICPHYDTRGRVSCCNYFKKANLSKDVDLALKLPECRWSNY